MVLTRFGTTQLFHAVNRSSEHLVKIQTYLIYRCLIAVLFFISILSKAEQPEEKTFATCEVSGGTSYLGKVRPKTMVALRGDH